MSDETQVGVWSDDLQCFWMAWQSCPDKGVIILALPTHSVCDMDGCIKVAKKLMTNVEKIIVWEGPEIGICYMRNGKKWVARDARAYTRLAALDQTGHVKH